MKYLERPLVFPCGGENLVGILSQPEGRAGIGVVIVVGGPQYRAGSHRLFVSLARALATAGYPVLRFDYRGMGDSSGQPRDFEGVTGDIAAAVSALQEANPGLTQVVLAGLCDGASAALLYLDETRDARVGGLMLFNPWVRSEASLARTQVKYYYGQRLLQKEFWLKVLRGELAVMASVRSLIGTLGASMAGNRSMGPAPKASFQTRMAQGWREFSGSILLVLSGDDYVAREFVDHTGSEGAWKGLLRRTGVETVDLPGADHTFSSRETKIRLEGILVQWLDRLVSGARRVA